MGKRIVDFDEFYERSGEIDRATTVWRGEIYYTAIFLGDDYSVWCTKHKTGIPKNRSIGDIYSGEIADDIREELGVS